MGSQNPSPQKDSGNPARAIGIGLTLPFTLVAPMVVGGAIGYFLDRWLYTKPAFLLVLGLLGLGIGIRDAVKSAAALDKK